MSSHVLEVEGLSKRFGELRAVDGLDLHVAHGETYGLLGPNGAGKSTAISMISGLLRPDAGSVRIEGDELRLGTTRLRSRIGLVPQEVAVYPDLTARENLTFFARLYDLPSERRASRVDEVLEVIGLSDRADDRAGTFSGGMKRRLNIGIGLLHSPILLVLDEPTVGIDPQSRNAILDAVERLSGEGMAVLYTTHYMEEAERLCDRIGIIDEGVLRAEGTRRELTASIGEQDRIRVELTGSSEAALRAVQDLPGVTSASVTGHELELLAEDAGTVVARVVDAVAGAEVEIAAIDISRPDLEDVFLHLTGKALRD